MTGRVSMSNLGAYYAMHASAELLNEKVALYIASAFFMWRERPSVFYEDDSFPDSAINHAVKYIQQIKDALTIRDLVTAEATKKTEIASTGTSHRTQDKDTTDATLTENGEFDQSSYGYPDGYTQAPDTAYIKAQVKDSAHTQNIGRTSEDSEVIDGEDTRDTTTQEIDYIAQAEQLKALTSVYSIIDEWARDSLLETIQGAF